MGRQTTLLFYRSWMEEETGENIPEMKFWSVSENKFDEYELMPYGCKEVGDEPDFDSFNLAKSSQEYIKKFNGFYDKYFPLVSETAINELVAYLKQFESTSTKYIILDSTSGGEICYVIRAVVRENVTVVIEIMNFDAHTETARVELTFEK